MFWSTCCSASESSPELDVGVAACRGQVVQLSEAMAFLLRILKWPAISLAGIVNGETKQYYMYTLVVTTTFHGAPQSRPLEWARSFTLPSADATDKLLRYEAHLDRQLYRAMDQLERLQRQRKRRKRAPASRIDLKEELDLFCETKPRSAFLSTKPSSASLQDPTASVGSSRSSCALEAWAVFCGDASVGQKPIAGKIKIAARLIAKASTD